MDSFLHQVLIRTCGQWSRLLSLEGISLIHNYLINDHQDHLWRPTETVNTSSALSLQFSPSHQYLPRKSLYTCLVPQVSWLLPKRQVLDCLVLIVNGFCIHESHRTTTNKVVLQQIKVVQTKQFTAHGYTRGPWTEKAGKNTHISVSPWKGLTTYFPSYYVKV